MSESIEVWRWVVPERGAYRVTNYSMTEADARKHYGADAMRIEGTREVHELVPARAGS